MTQLDWLSHLLNIIPVTGRAEHRCILSTPWRLENPSTTPGEIPYHIILAGSAILDGADGQSPLRLHAGDVLLLTRGPRYVLHDGGGGIASPNERIGATIALEENDGQREQCSMLCGRFIFAEAHAALIREHLPARLVVNAAEHSSLAERLETRAQLPRLVRLMRAECAQENLGGQVVLGAMSTVLFTLTIRLAIEDRETCTGLLKLAGHPRLGAALSAMLAAPSHPWTISELANLCGMSRLTFISHFQRNLGRSAFKLLTDVRMTAAAIALRSSSAPVAAIGENVGYQSEAAFRRSFHKHVGVTPAEYRRRAATEGKGEA